MPVRTNGGVFNNQILTGSLKHFRITGADFSGAVDSNNRPVTGSAAEIIYTHISAKATIVIMNPISNTVGMSFALETNRADWDETKLQDMLASLPDPLGIDNIDMVNLVVEQVPYDLLGTTSFIELTDTPTTYAGSATYKLVVNSTGDGITFIPDKSIGNVVSVDGRKGVVTLDDLYAPFLHSHSKSQIIDFDDDDYATSEQGDKADSALQPGDNVSELVNDAGYLKPEDVPADVVTSIFGRIGDVIAEEGDYELNLLDDVTITTPEEDQYIIYRGGEWVNSDIILPEPEIEPAFVEVSVSVTAELNKKYLVIDNLVTITLPTNARNGDAIVVAKTSSVSTTLIVSDGTDVLGTDLGNDTSLELDMTEDINFVFENGIWNVLFGGLLRVTPDAVFGT